jgi:hypothetical protein
MCARKVFQIFQKFLGLYFCKIIHEKGWGCTIPYTIQKSRIFKKSHVTCLYVQVFTEVQY